MTGERLGDGAGLLPGIETLPLRMDRHCANGLAVAEFLESHPKVAWVSHAGLESNKYRPLAVKYLRGHGGSVFTFGLKGGYEAGINVGEFVGPCLRPLQVVSWTASERAAGITAGREEPVALPLVKRNAFTMPISQPAAVGCNYHARASELAARCVQCADRDACAQWSGANCSATSPT